MLLISADCLMSQHPIPIPPAPLSRLPPDDSRARAACFAALSRLFARHRHYPEETRSHGLEGQVVLLLEINRVGGPAPSEEAPASAVWAHAGASSGLSLRI
jgi:outer membrane biosynthesis protein TonB